MLCRCFFLLESVSTVLGYVLPRMQRSIDANHVRSIVSNKYAEYVDGFIRKKEVSGSGGAYRSKMPKSCPRDRTGRAIKV